MHWNRGNRCWLRTVTPELRKQIWLTVAPGECKDVFSGTFKCWQCPVGILSQAGRIGFGVGGAAARGTSGALWLQ